MELVWENGKVLVRDPSSSTRTTQPRPSCAKRPFFTKMKMKGADWSTTANSDSLNVKTLHLTSFLHKCPERNNCFESSPESYETNLNPLSVHRSSFSVKKHCDNVTESRLIFTKPRDAYGSTSRIMKGDSQPPTGCGCANLSKSVLQVSGKDKRTSKDYVDSIEVMDGLQVTKWKELQGSKNNKKMDVTSVSHSLKPAANLPGSGHSATVLPTTQGDSLYAEKSTNKDIKVSTSHGSCLRGQPWLQTAKTNFRPFNVKTYSLPDQQSSAVVPLADSSKYSQGASNNPDITITRNYQQTGDQSEYQSNCDGQSEDANKSAPARGKVGKKRKRIAKVHSLSEKSRRDKITKRLRTLQELIPNCRKVDKTSILDETIEYLKTLQLQLQIMTAGHYMPPPMISPPGLMQQLQTSSLAYCPTMDTVSALRMGMGAACSGTLQFPTSPISGAAAAMRDGINLQMQGVPSSVSTMPMTALPPHTFTH